MNLNVNIRGSSGSYGKNGKSMNSGQNVIGLERNERNNKDMMDNLFVRKLDDVRGRRKEGLVEKLERNIKGQEHGEIKVHVRGVGDAKTDGK